MMHWCRFSCRSCKVFLALLHVSELFSTWREETQLVSHQRKGNRDIDENVYSNERWRLVTSCRRQEILLKKKLHCSFAIPPWQKQRWTDIERERQKEINFADFENCSFYSFRVCITQFWPMIFEKECSVTQLLSSDDIWRLAAMRQSHTRLFCTTIHYAEIANDCGKK